jgi:microcystin-dependent protein
VSNPFIGEIRLFGGNFAPAGWMFCAGQSVPISEYDNLFNLIGTTYGGDGQQTFNLPDLRGRIPIHRGQNFAIGQLGGEESVTLQQPQLPNHAHQGLATTDVGIATVPNGQVLAAPPVATVSAYGTDAPLTKLFPESISPMGGNEPHENIQPYQVLSYIISLFGIFPPPN